ncbi:MAG: carbohydrate ABC transporter permease [Acidimicrobiales bacterium]
MSTTGSSIPATAPLRGTGGIEDRSVAPAGTKPHREWPLALLMLSPSIAVFGVFIFYPLVRTIWLGFYDVNIFGDARWVGFSQYAEVLTSSQFRDSLWATVLFTFLTVPLGMVAGLALAVLAHQRLRGIGVFRTMFSSTVATSVAVASLMWLTLLNPSVGIINQALRGVGQDPINFLQHPSWALPSVALATVWLHLGFTFIIMSAGLQSVPDELLESAVVDGASPWMRFREVTLPLLSPTMLFALVVLTINAFQSFGQIDLLTQGGPLGRTNVLVYSIFRQVPTNPGVASVQAFALFGIVLTLTLVQFKVLERRVFYGD